MLKTAAENDYAEYTDHSKSDGFYGIHLLGQPKI